MKETYIFPVDDDARRGVICKCEGKGGTIKYFFFVYFRAKKFFSLNLSRKERGQANTARTIVQKDEEKGDGRIETLYIVLYHNTFPFLLLGLIYFASSPSAGLSAFSPALSDSTE